MLFENLLNISIKKDWVDYLSALLMPTVAVFGMYIAYRQWRTEEMRLRHELFERRYKQFDAVTKFVVSVMSLSVQDNEYYPTCKEGDILWAEIAGMEFIFSSEIKDYVNTHIIGPYEEIQDLRVQSEQNAARQRELKIKLRESLQKFQEKTLQYMQLQQPSTLQKLRQYLPVLFEKIKTAAD